MRSSLTTTRTALAVLAAGLLLTTAACGADDAETPSSEVAGVRTEAGSSGEGTTQYPVSVENCGRTVTFEEAPQRVVSGWPTSDELLVALGVEDRVVGRYNTSQGSPPAEGETDTEALAERAAELPVLSQQAPSKEALLAADPDLIWADGSYLFDGQQLPTIEDLEASGTQVLVLTGFCEDGGGSTVADVDTDVELLSTVLGVPDRGEEIITDVNERLDAASGGAPVGDAVPVAMVGVTEGTIFAFEGVYSDMLERAGGVNELAGTLPEGTYYGELSVEELTASDPETLVYLLGGGETEEQAAAALAERLPTVSAVKSDRVIYLPQVDSTNLRVVDGVEKLASALRDLG